jgi:hypothetical protein
MPRAKATRTDFAARFHSSRRRERWPLSINGGAEEPHHALRATASRHHRQAATALADHGYEDERKPGRGCRAGPNAAAARLASMGWSLLPRTNFDSETTTTGLRGAAVAIAAIRHDAGPPVRLRHGTWTCCLRALKRPKRPTEAFETRPASRGTSCRSCKIAGLCLMARPGLEPGTPRFSAACPPRANVSDLQRNRERASRRCVPEDSRTFLAIAALSGTRSRTCAQVT